MPVTGKHNSIRGAHPIDYNSVFLKGYLMIHRNSFLAMMTAVILLVICISHLDARQNKDIIANKDVFGELKKPPARFSHDFHASVFEDQGCGVCHHVLDKNSGKLGYQEGEELGCVDCHGRKKAGNTPALREAYHGSCNTCHRSMRNKNMKSGPITCGECHPKQ